jgi:hypothetical protein
VATPAPSGGIGGLFDAYSRHARLAPLFYVAAPILLFCITIVPALTAWYRLVPLAVTAGSLILFDQLGRDRGRRLQPQLWASWGGAPTTVALRHRETSNAVLLARRHDQLKVLTGQALPTRRQEQQNPAKADQAYEAAAAYLRAHTRDHDKFPLVFAENRNYGFCRNMLGLRPLGLGAAVVASVAASAALTLSILEIGRLPIAGAAVALSISFAAIVLWWRIVTPEWVRPKAEAYAQRLLEAVEVLVLARNGQSGAK